MGSSPIRGIIYKLFWLDYVVEWYTRYIQNLVLRLMGSSPIIVISGSSIGRAFV